MSSFFILDPSSPPVGGGVLSKRLDTFDDKIIGVLWNGRRPGSWRPILRGVVEKLREHYKIKDVLFKTKPFFGNVAPDDILTYFGARAHAIITGVGD